MELRVNPVNNLHITINIDTVGEIYYGEVMEDLIDKDEGKLKFSHQAETIDEILKIISEQICQAYKENGSLKVSRDGEDLMGQVLLFNPEGDDDVSNRTIIKGTSTKIFQLNNTKYSWAKNLYQVMIGNFRVPEKVKGLGEDGVQYKNSLTDEERRAYDGILSFLIFLDSLQTMNLPNINDFVTAPEINLILAIQDYQEAIHSQSYATILESVVPAEKRDGIYYFWKDDQHLLDRIKFIGQIYQDFVDYKTDENFFRTVVGNYLLESIYFYNGFAYFDTLADMGKMVASQRMINYIRRDELTHVTIFAHLLKNIKKEFPEMFDEKMIYEMFKTAVDQEISWSTHIIGQGVIGINENSIEKYTKRLANQRLEMIGLNPIYPDFTENTYKHLERLQDHNSEKGNFFESTVTNYTQSSSMKGTWDF